MRFDMRAPVGGASTTDLYRAAIEMAQYGDEHGAAACVISEHHASPDGYLPAPMLLTTAMAARTSRMRFMIGALLLPFTDPIRLAEEINVLDAISGGRVMYTFGLGYRPEEYEQFGISWDDRGRVADEKLELLLRAVQGEPFEHEGRRIHVTPPPATPGGPMISWGGGSKAAARRAGRFGLGLLAQIDTPGIREAYEDSCRAAGHEPGLAVLTPPDAVTAVFVADDVDRAWDELGSYLLHDALMYGAWNEGKVSAAVSHAQTIDEVRAEPGGTQIWSVEEAVESVRAGRGLGLMPLCGGIPPEIAWPYVERVVQDVLPAVS
jgi:alkanesulfonate monooxygenase SsuD/methylene tetrahydromethanopterin reductase-like flavin-dependent oxidoreductase (luciferase family)